MTKRTGDYSRYRVRQKTTLRSIEMLLDEGASLSVQKRMRILPAEKISVYHFRDIMTTHSRLISLRVLPAIRLVCSTLVSIRPFLRLRFPNQG